MKATTFDDHVIPVEDAQSGQIFHFAVGEAKGFRFLGVQTDPPRAIPPAVDPTMLSAAEAVARAFAKEEGWL